MVGEGPQVVGPDGAGHAPADVDATTLAVVALARALARAVAPLPDAVPDRGAAGRGPGVAVLAPAVAVAGSARKPPAHGLVGPGAAVTQTRAAGAPAGRLHAVGVVLRPVSTVARGVVLVRPAPAPQGVVVPTPATAPTALIGLVDATTPRDDATVFPGTGLARPGPTVTARETAPNGVVALFLGRPVV